MTRGLKPGRGRPYTRRAPLRPVTISRRTYVRFDVSPSGRHTSRWGPRPSLIVCDEIVSAKAAARLIESVRTTSSRTVAGAVSRKRTIARSRKPSPFGLTVVSRAVSPANGLSPCETVSPSRRGGDGAAGANPAAVTASTSGNSAEANPLIYRIVPAEVGFTHFLQAVYRQ